VELLVTITILGLAIVVLVGALADTILASSAHRQHTTADTIARGVTDAVKSANYTTSYDPSVWSNVNVPSSFNVTATTKCLPVGTTPGRSLATSAFDQTCTATTLGSGLQLVTVTVTSTAKGEKDFVTLVKRGTP
jgi:type II secretory pathway pseudopilin PulG